MLLLSPCLQKHGGESGGGRDHIFSLFSESLHRMGKEQGRENPEHLVGALLWHLTIAQVPTFCCPPVPHPPRLSYVADEMGREDWGIIYWKRPFMLRTTFQVQRYKMGLVPAQEATGETPFSNSTAQTPLFPSLSYTRHIMPCILLSATQSFPRQAKDWSIMNEGVAGEPERKHEIVLKHWSLVQTTMHNRSEQRVPDMPAQSHSWACPCSCAFNLQFSSLPVQFVVSVPFDSWNASNTASVCVLFLKKFCCPTRLTVSFNSMSPCSFLGTNTPPICLPCFLLSCWVVNLKKMQPAQSPLAPI